MFHAIRFQRVGRAKKHLQTYKDVGHPRKLRKLRFFATMYHRLYLRWGTGKGEADELAAQGGGTIFRATINLDKPSAAGEREGEDRRDDASAGAGAVGAAGVDSDGAAFVVAVASVDQAWGLRLVKGSPDTGPQVC